MYMLPFPRGIFGIGVEPDYFMDTKRTNDFFGRNEKRELIIYTWFPTDEKINCIYPYGDPAILDKLIKFDDSLLGNILYWKKFLGISPLARCAHSNPNHPKTSLKDKTYPIIIFCPGYGAPAFLYSALIEDLTSSGFIVIGMNHTPYNGVTVLPDGKVIPGIPPSLLHTDTDLKIAIEHASQDVSFIIDQLELLNKDSTSRWYKILDLEHIGIMGHSFGGSVAVHACRNEKRIKAGIDLDGWLGNRKNHDGFSVPFLFVLSDHYYPTKQRFFDNVEDIRTTCNNSIPPALVKYQKNARHLSFCDFNLFAFPFKFIIPIERKNQLLTIEKIRTIINQFFNQHLRQNLQPSLSTGQLHQPSA